MEGNAPSCPQISPTSQDSPLAVALDRAEFGLEAKATRIETLQRGWTSQHDEQRVRDIFLSTHGSDLFRLKALIDQGANEHDLCKLIFEDIDDESIRTEILTHFSNEAAKLGKRFVRALSDIDDTLIASIHEKRVPHKSLYPGSLQLLREISSADSESPYSSVFLTARPDGPADLIEAATHHKLEKIGAEYSSVLSGDLLKLLSSGAMAAGKIENFSRLARVFPECSFVFIGDNGQGDVIFAQAIDGNPNLCAALIHRVKEEFETPDAENVHYFKTHVDAARLACEIGLIPSEAYQRVKQAARAEFEALLFESEEQRCRYLDLIK